MNLLRRVRGILGSAATWAAVFSCVEAALIGVYLLRPHPVLPKDFVIVALSQWAITGAMSGGVFATIIMVAERRRTLATLSTERFVAWGALAGGVAFACRLGLMRFYSGATDVWAPALTSGIVGGVLGCLISGVSLRFARCDVETPLPADEVAQVGGSGSRP
jgi:hypothetical protein